MIPRTVQVAKSLEAQLTASELEDYGNIIINGYLSVVPNSINKKAWQYKETTTAPVDLPSLSTVRPALKGWVNNYQNYFTQQPPNAYGTVPGTPANGFQYLEHSFKQPSGGILGLVFSGPIGSGYTDGTYNNVATTTATPGASGATLDLVVTGGEVVSVTINAGGTGYEVGSSVEATGIGPGTGFYVIVSAINVTAPGGDPRWSQQPARDPGSTVYPVYGGFIYPTPDNADAPPIDIL